MTDLDPADWAVRYAASGLAVVPLHSVRGDRCTCRRQDCTSPGKHPLTPHGKDDASTDATQVAEWWRRWPFANLGLRPPPGIVVLDVDPRHGGATALLDLTRQHGQLPRTLTCRTGSSGYHVWLSYAGRSRGTLCPGVDVRTSSHYLVAPPSLHACGRRYEWVTGLPTARAPRWVRRLLDPPAPAHVPPVRTGGRIDPLVRTVAEAVEGNRNAALYWAACRAHESGLDTGSLVAAAVAAGLPESDAIKTAASAARAAPRKVATR